MFSLYGAGWLYIESHSPDPDHPVIARATVDVGGRNRTIFATIALSTYTQGESFSTGLNGEAVALIRRWVVYNEDGTTKPVDPGPDHMENNFVVIPNAASVTFQLNGYLVIAYAQASIYTL